MFKRLIVFVVFIVVVALMAFLLAATCFHNMAQAGSRSLTVMNETVLIPDEVPNFATNRNPRGQIDFYRSTMIEVTDTTYEDPNNRDEFLYHVISVYMVWEKRIIIAGVIVIDHGKYLASYLDKEFFAHGSPSGDLTKVEGGPKLKLLINMLEERRPA